MICYCTVDHHGPVVEVGRLRAYSLRAQPFISLENFNKKNKKSFNGKENSFKQKPKLSGVRTTNMNYHVSLSTFRRLGHK
jgi:hypothetical protein